MRHSRRQAVATWAGNRGGRRAREASGTDGRRSLRFNVSGHGDSPDRHHPQRSAHRAVRGGPDPCCAPRATTRSSTRAHAVRLYTGGDSPIAALPGAGDAIYWRTLTLCVPVGGALMMHARARWDYPTRIYGRMPCARTAERWGSTVSRTPTGSRRRSHYHQGEARRTACSGHTTFPWRGALHAPTGAGYAILARRAADNHPREGSPGVRPRLRVGQCRRTPSHPVPDRLAPLGVVRITPARG